MTLDMITEALQQQKFGYAEFDWVAIMRECEFNSPEYWTARAAYLGMTLIEYNQWLLRQ